MDSIISLRSMKELSHLVSHWLLSCRHELAKSLTVSVACPTQCSGRCYLCQSILTRYVGVSSQAHEISPPFGISQCSGYSCYIEYQNKPFQIFWSHNSFEYPNFSKFPQLDNATSKSLPLSRAMARTWADTNLVAFGTSACIRCIHTGSLPLLKIAHPNFHARACLAYEFDLLRQMSEQGLPVPKYGVDPLQDDDGIYGYRLECLSNISNSELPAYTQRIRDAVQHLHRKGFVHGDISPSNVMVNQAGEVVLIDFSYSGISGARIPAHIPRMLFQDENFHKALDDQRMDRFFPSAT